MEQLGRWPVVWRNEVGRTSTGFPIDLADYLGGVNSRASFVSALDYTSKHNRPARATGRPQPAPANASASRVDWRFLGLCDSPRQRTSGTGTGPHRCKHNKNW